METSLTLWTSLLGAGIYLCLIAIPWAARRVRAFLMIVGFGGVAVLLGFDAYVGFSHQDIGLALNLMLLTLTKAVFFFGLSWLVERVVGAFFFKK
ncbi:hypothetical protein [Sneathiella chinensis]|uniref:Uncharacterized protein n=1 Tax=Sneathiella chinensis TaxID=349750 RepID=A0ABQ5TZ61_9PROT|nr:hypothetical protein [Sneathiella chinensis]GLQ05282.1 hypothetical protein GCM10007924_05030 [Sneathiella chinensis]